AAGTRLVPAITRAGYGHWLGRCRCRSPANRQPMSTTDDGDEGPVHGPGSFVHLDVTSAYSRLASPNTPLEYVTALTRQFPLNDLTPVDQPRPAIALADYGLQSAVKMAVACARAGVEHLCGLRVRLVPGASQHPRADRSHGSL